MKDLVFTTKETLKIIDCSPRTLAKRRCENKGKYGLKATIRKGKGGHDILYSTADIEAMTLEQKPFNIPFIQDKVLDESNSYDQRDMEDILDQLFEGLTNRELKAIIMWFGITPRDSINPSDEPTMIYGVTKERILTIEARAMLFEGHKI